MNFRLGCVVVLFGVLGCTKEENGAAKVSVPEPTPVWSLSDDKPDQNVPVFAMGEFEIRPPTELSFVKHSAAGQQYYVWATSIRPDETYGLLSINIQDLPAGYLQSMSLEKHFEEVIPVVKQGREQWQSGAVERGQINGHPFVRMSWSGLAPPTARKGLQGKMTHGVVYLGAFGSRSVQILFHDVGADPAESFRVFERMIATFRPSTSKPAVKP